MSTITETAEMTCEIDVVTIGLVCDDCALIVTTDDASGVDQEREEECRAAIAAIRRDEGGPLVITDPHAEGVQLYRCTCCGDDVMGAGWVGAVIIER